MESLDVTNNSIMWMETYIVFGLIISCFNILQIIVIYKINKKIPKSMIFILNLSCSDLFVGTVVALSAILRIIVPPQNEGLFIQTLRYCGLRIGLVISLGNLVLIAFDRLLSVFYPFKYPLIPRRRFIIFIVIIWSISIASPLIWFVVLSEADPEIFFRKSNIGFPILTIFAISEMIFSYVFIWFRIRRQNRKFAIRDTE
eukprot:TCONS_00007968-protein